MKVICPYCGKELEEIEDEIAEKKTGHQFKCDCLPENVKISIG